MNPFSEPSWSATTFAFGLGVAAKATVILMIADKGEPWTQAIVGPLSNRIASAYGIDDENVSTALLIGPDGKIAVTDLWRVRIGKAISEALGRIDK